MSARHVRLGLRENLAQFSLLVVVNAFVGAMVGMERSILPAIAEQEFSPRGKHRGALVHRRLRRDQGADATTSPDASPTASGASTCSSRGWLVAAARAVPADVGAELELGARRQRAARRQPGAHLVDDGDHEDRSRRTAEARARDGPQRVRRLLRRGGQRARDRLDRGALRPAARAVLPRRRLRRRSGSLLSVFAVRETKHHVAAEVEAARRAPRERAPDAARGLLAHDAARPEPLERQPGRASSTTSTTAWRGACSRCSSRPRR